MADEAIIEIDVGLQSKTKAEIDEYLAKVEKIKEGLAEARASKEVGGDDRETQESATVPAGDNSDDDVDDDTNDNNKDDRLTTDDLKDKQEQTRKAQEMQELNAKSATANLKMQQQIEEAVEEQEKKSAATSKKIKLIGKEEREESSDGYFDDDDNNGTEEKKKKKVEKSKKDKQQDQKAEFSEAELNPEAKLLLTNPQKYIQDKAIDALKTQFEDVLESIPVVALIILAVKLAEYIIKLMVVKGGPLNRDFRRFIQAEVDVGLSRELVKRRELGIDQVIISQSGGRFVPNNTFSTYNSLYAVTESRIARIGLDDRAAGVTIP